MAGEIEILSEAELRNISRNLSAIISSYDGTRFNGYEKTPGELLDSLLLTTIAPTLAAKHRAAVCDALGGFLEHGAASKSNIRELCLSASTWQRGLSAYLERSEDATKPMRQLLITLVRLLKKHSPVEAANITQDAVVRCLTFIHASEDLSSVKPSMLTIEVLLNKSSITSAELCLLSSMVGKENGSLKTSDMLGLETPDISMIEAFIKQILSWAQYAHIAPAVSKLLAAFFKELKGSSLRSSHMEGTLPLWFNPIRELALQGDDMLDTVKRQILPNLLKVNYSTESSQVKECLKVLGYENMLTGNIGGVAIGDLKLCLLLMDCLGTDSGVNSSDGLYNPPGNQNWQGSRVAITLCLLNHHSPEIRVHALSLLFPGPGTPFITLSPTITNALLSSLPSFHAETDTRARNEFLGIVKKMFHAVQNAINKEAKLTVERLKKSNDADTKLREPMSESFHGIMPSSFLVEFLRDYLNQLYINLLPTSSYQRHTSALTSLKHAVNSGLVDTYSIKIHTPRFMRVLLDLTLDAFDDVRAGASELLRNFPSSMLCSIFASSKAADQHLANVLTRAESMMRESGRADYADGFGRLYELHYGCIDVNSIGAISHRHTVLIDILYALEGDVAKAEQDLFAAVATAPIHGRLIALRYIASRADIIRGFTNQEMWRKFHEDLMQCFTRIWNVVKPVLCVDSPEGSTEDAAENDYDIGTKDTLSYSWRTLKEASSLVQCLLNNESYGYYNGKRRLSLTDYKALGDASFTQLAELRHRGAFSTVSQTFATCCMQCVQAEDREIRDLPKHWYHETLKCIEEKASALTRRSAGLPAMISGILSAYPNDDFFSSVIQELQDIAIQSVDNSQAGSVRRLPQVHALNCIKDVFTNSRLAVGTECHIPDTFIVAVGCLENDIWAIRNCGIMLFKALLTRLTGGSGSNTVGTEDTHRRFPRAVFTRYAELSDLVVQQLERSCLLVDSEERAGDTTLQIQVCFPAMEIIDRIGVPFEHRDVVSGMLLRLLGSEVWNVREKAARTLSTFISPNVITEHLSKISTVRAASTNLVHGLLLCLKYIIKHAKWTQIPDASESIHIITDFGGTLFDLTKCPYVVAAYTHCLAGLLTTLKGDELRDTISKVDKNVDMITSYLQVTKAHHLAREGLTSLKIKLATSEARVNNSALSTRQFYTDVLPLSDRKLLYTTFDNLQLHAPVADLGILNNLFEIAPSLLSPVQPDYASMMMEHLALVTDESVPGGALEEPELLEKLVPNAKSVLSKINPSLAVQPQDIASGLRLQGSLLYLLTKTSVVADEMSQYVQQWARALSIALDERSDFQLRLAAVSSIYSFRTVLRPSKMDGPNNTNNLLPVYLALHDALHDDDDEVRGIAATVVSWVGSTPGKLISLNSVSAAQWLVEFLGNSYRDAADLLVHAIQRITGGQVRSHSLLGGSSSSIVDTSKRHVQRVICQAMQADTSLFVEEKQNLYKDDVREAEQWCSVLKEFHHEAMPAKYLEYMASWTSTGLRELIEIAGITQDGAVGWCSKLEMFKSGMLVLATAEITQLWNPNSGKFQQQLTKLRDIGMETGMHDHWLDRITALLESSSD